MGWYVRCNKEITKTPVDDDLEDEVGTESLRKKRKKKKNQMTGVDGFRERARERGERDESR